MLSSLPETLDETYERMLCNINCHSIEDARRILTLLCFAHRPLTVRELIDGIAVELNNSTGLNPKRRLLDSDSILDVCGGFIDISLGADHTIDPFHEEKEDLTSTVRIAHFSVQEYLESERIQHQKAAKFSLIRATSHAEIAQICLLYLLEPGLSSSTLDASILKEYPLAHYAAMHWHDHYKNSASFTPELSDCILRLFQRQNSFATWVRLHDIAKSWKTRIDFSRPLNQIPAPIYYASFLGLNQALHALICTEDPESPTISALPFASNSKVLKQINAQVGDYGSALQAASDQGHEKVVQLLLDRGADVNAQGGYYGTALQAASRYGHEKVVQLLLDRGADVNAQGEYHSNALQAASYEGHEKVVQLLLDRGADVNAQGEYHSNALQAASYEGHEKVVQILLDKGAFNAECMKDAWRAAIFSCNGRMIQLLREHDQELGHSI